MLACSRHDAILWARRGLGRKVLLAAPVLQLVAAKHTTPQRLTPEDIPRILAQPTWSVTALRPTQEELDHSSEVSIKQVHHLLRLSALPGPSSAEEESQILRDLHAQLHFVKDIQKVDTTGVKPLQTIRDESFAAHQENEMNMRTMKDALDEEEIVGKVHRRIRRRTDLTRDTQGVEDWDLLSQAPKKIGKFIVVESAERGD